MKRTKQTGGGLKERCTLTDAAQALGKSIPSLSVQAKSHNIRKGKDGLYDSAALMRASALGDELDKRNLAAPADDDESLIAQKMRKQIALLQVQIDTAKQNLATLRGEFVAIEEHRAEIRELCEAFRRALDIWIKTTAAEDGRPEFKRKLEEARRRAFAVIQEGLE